MRWFVLALLLLVGCRLFQDYELLDGVLVEEFEAPPPPEDGLRLETGPVEVSGFGETERCIAFKNGDEGRFVQGVDVAGTASLHHILLFKVGVDLPDGEVDCIQTLDAAMGIEVDMLELLFGSYDQPASLIFPAGYGVELPEKQQLYAVVHFVNSASQPVASEAILDVHFASVDVQPLFTYSLINMGFVVPPETDEHVVTTACTLPTDLDLFSVTPHMHALGIGLVAEHEDQAGVVTTLLDGPLEPLVRYVDPPMAMREGDTVRFSCTWANPFDREVGFSDDLSGEMCSVIGYAAGLQWPVALSDLFGGCVVE